MHFALLTNEHILKNIALMQHMAPKNLLPFYKLHCNLLSQTSKLEKVPMHRLHENICGCAASCKVKNRKKYHSKHQSENN